MTVAPTPWLGTEPGDAEHPEMDDVLWRGPTPWWARFSSLNKWSVKNDVDRVCGPEYRMNWEQTNG